MFKKCWAEYTSPIKRPLLTSVLIVFVKPKIVQNAKLKLKQLADEQKLEATRALVPYPEGAYDPTKNVGVLDDPFLDIMGDEVEGEGILYDLQRLVDSVELDYEIFVHMMLDSNWTCLVESEDDWPSVPFEKIPLPGTLIRDFTFVEKAIHEARRVDAATKVFFLFRFFSWFFFLHTYTQHTHTHTHTHNLHIGQNSSAGNGSSAANIFAGNKRRRCT